MKIPYKIYIRSLPKSTERRNNMTKLMEELKWDFEFWDNTHYEDEEFDNFVRNGGIERVEGYLKRINDLAKKRYDKNPGFLYPAQAANHFSMLKLFKHIEDEKISEDFIIIGEDDLVIKKYAGEVLERVLPTIKEDMFICGLGWGWDQRRRMEHANHKPEAYRVRGAVFRFCNPLFVTNLKTVKYINKNFVNGKIDMPCDVWLHKYTTILDNKIPRRVVFPALCNELSFYGRIDSEILPKRSRLAYLGSKKNISDGEKEHLKDLREEYNNKHKIWSEYWRKNYGL